MLKHKRIMDTKLQNMRFNKVIPYIKGDVLDYGGSQGEIKKFVKGIYLCVDKNTTHLIKKQKFDTILLLAVIEHMNKKTAILTIEKLKKRLKPKGKIVITTPKKISHSILILMDWVGIGTRKNWEDHKYYWNKQELLELAYPELKIELYKTFQIGINQLIILKKI